MAGDGGRPARQEGEMRAVVQRVSSASVSVAGETVASIGRGLLVYIGVEKGDDDKDPGAMADKIATLRIFEDDGGAMNRSVVEVGGEALVVSQFTLLADCRKGRRPSFTDAMGPSEAEAFYERFVRELEQRAVPARRGRFRAVMQVASVNDGPVTVLIDSRKRF